MTQDMKFAALAATLAFVSCSAAYSGDEATLAAPTPAAQAAAPPVLQANSAPDILTCDVTASPTRNGVLIEGRAFAERDVDGEYSLVITKSGRSGSSDVNQGGPLRIAGGDSETLGQTELSVERGARLSARLIVRDEQGVLCRRSVSL